jgi:ferric enterobactin receptor
MHKEILFCLLLSFVLPAGSFSQSNLLVSGIVKDIDSGEALPSANVFIKGSYIGTTTNVDGFFTLLNLPSDTTTLEISYVGYSMQVIKLNNAIIGKRLVISLKPISTSLQELVITDNSNKFLKTNSGVSHATIATKQLSLLPSIGEVDIFRSLQLLPGVSGTNENSSGLFVRGGTPDQNLVLLDGITIYKVDHFFGFFSAFNANAVKDVQLYKGAFPAKYGGRISSVVDLSGKTGNFEETHGEIGLNLISINGYLEVPISKKVSFLFAGRRSYTDVLQSGIFKALRGNLLDEEPFPNLPNNTANLNSTVNVIEPIFYFYDWNSKISFKPSDKDLFSLSLYQGADYLDKSRDLNLTINNVAPQPIVAQVNIDEFTNWGNRGAALRWSRQWNPKFYSNVNVAASTYFSDYIRNGALDVTIPEADSVIFSGKQVTVEDNNVNDFSLRIDNEWLLSSTHNLELGFAYTKSGIVYDNVRDDSLVLLSRQQNASFSAIYLSDSWQATPRLKIIGGIRATYYDLTEDILVAPRLAATYEVNDRIKLKGAYGKHYQFVNQITNENITGGSRDFWLLADGNQVKVSSANHYISGISYETNGWLFDMEGYYKQLYGLSEFSLRFQRGPQRDLTNLFFSGNGIAKGVEFLVQKKQGNYTGWVSYTLGRVTYNFPEINDGLDFPALHDQRHELKIVQSYQANSEWNFSASFIFGSGKPFSEPEGKYSVELLDGRTSSYVNIGPKNGSRLPFYHRLDISAHHFFPLGNKLKGDLGISIFNFYGRQNIWYLSYDFAQDPVLITEVRYLGFTPNVSLNIKF